jgi:soluble lytic murein transglycosylase-like protein
MATKDNTFWIVLAGVIGTLLFLKRQAIGDTVTATLSGWQTVEQGPVWVPVINTTEQQLGIPTNLLARMAYEESRFRPDVIDGTTPSSAGALGILQLMPQYFNTVTVPRPFSQADTVNQISQAGAQLVFLFNQFGDWTLAVAGYNAGAGTVSQFLAGSRSLPAETQNYVSQILADVPVVGALA